jgi:hypothetical protein
LPELSGLKEVSKILDAEGGKSIPVYADENRYEMQRGALWPVRLTVKDITFSV